MTINNILFIYIEYNLIRKMSCSRKKNVAYHKTVDLISNKLTGPGRLEFNTFEDSEVRTLETV